MRVLSATLGVFLAGSVLVSGAELIPGGETARKSVEARRGKTALSKLAASMKPGTWAELKTEMPKGLWSSPLVDGGRNKGGAGGLHIAGWTDDAHWDSRTGQFLYMGLRQTRQFIAYSEEKNAWRAIELDRKSDNPVFQTDYGHIYGTNGFDHERGRFYHLHRDFKDLKGGISYFDTATEKWTKLPPKPPTSGGMALEYSGAQDGLLLLGKQAWFFSNQRQKWEDLGSSPVDGYHSLMRWNPYRQEILMAGGNNGRQVVARFTKAGKIERLKDAPVNLSVHDLLTVDPLSGRYLILGFNEDKKTEAFEFDSDQNEFRPAAALAGQWPFNRYAMPVVAFIPEYGVTMWAEQKVYLYKHDAARTKEAK
ncbi:MAG: hypothetical protein JNM56_05350 [Planctomycetia bacterium]|nr:hypothetical protein [Planctomycetia bacterium]